ncbi:hypothetical protein ACMFMG_004529 [Clarireedia jacksonii]
MDQYRSWISCSTSCLMSCYGIPGSGKSVTASSLIDGLQSTVCGVQQNVALAYYYCDYADKRTLTRDGLFGCISQQLLGQKIELSNSLMDSMDAMFPNEMASASLDEIVKLLTNVINEFQSVIVFIDGTDELPENDRNATFQNLRKVIEVTSSPIKLFVSGRADISDLFPPSDKLAVVRVNIRKDSITSDINSYLRYSISELMQSEDLVIGNPSLAEDIFSALSAGAQGMFLWAKFQLDELCQLETDAAISKALQNLPRDLEETFDRLLQRVLGDERRELVKRMFNWIVCAQRPLHMDELREGIAFTVTDEFWDASKIPNDLKRLVRACGNLVIIDEETENVQFAHHTVEQYLLYPQTSTVAYFHTTKEEASLEIGGVCAAYLCFSDFELQVIPHNMITPNMAALQQVVNTRSVIPYSSGGVRQVVAVANAMMAPRRTDQHIPSCIDFARHISKSQRPTEEFYRKYCLLSYIKENWLWHMKSFTEETRQTTAGRLFRKLLFQKQLLFLHRPWDGFSLGDRLLRCATLGWAISAGHMPLLHELLAEERGALGYVGQACHKFWRPHLDKQHRMEAPVKIPEKATNFHLNLNNLASVSDYLEWLYVQMLIAAQNGSIQVIQLCLNCGFIGSSSEITPYVRAHLQLEASIHKQFNIVPLLSEGSYNIWVSYERNGTDVTALDIATDSAKTEIVFFLLEHGCPVSHQTSTRLLKGRELTRAVITERKGVLSAVIKGLQHAEFSRRPSILSWNHRSLMFSRKDDTITDQSLYDEISENEGLTNAVVVLAEQGMTDELEKLFEFTVPPYCGRLYGLMARHIVFLAALTYDFPDLIDAVLRFEARVQDITTPFCFFSPISQPTIAIMEIDAAYTYAKPIDYLFSGDKRIKLSEETFDIILYKVVDAFARRIGWYTMQEVLDNCSWRIWDAIMEHTKGEKYLSSFCSAKSIIPGDGNYTPLSGLIDMRSWRCLPVADFDERTELSLLLWTVLYNRLEAVKQLFNYHAAQGAWGNHSCHGLNTGEMALLCAIIAGSFEMIKILVDQGVSTFILWKNSDSTEEKDMLTLVVKCQPRSLHRYIVDLIVSRDYDYWARMNPKIVCHLEKGRDDFYILEG